MRVVWIFTGVLAAASAGCFAQAGQAEAPATLVREVVFNELHDHDRHGYWRYWVEHRSPHETRLEEQVETADGPLTRAVLVNGHPLDARGEECERHRLSDLLGSPAQQAAHRQAYLDDERRIGRIVALLPDAFLYEDAGEQDGLRHLKFRPNPGYPARSIEARIFHAMSGDLWVDARMKRLARLSGRLEENVDFGFGLLGRLYKGGWFLLDRIAVSATDWKTDRLEVHMNGRAMLFKTIAHETSEARGGFVPVPAAMNLNQGFHVLDDSAAAARTQALLTGTLSPVTFR